MTTKRNPAVVPDYEDLSSARFDESTVLEAVYGDDFSSATGAWNCPTWAVNVQPPDIDTETIGSRLTLSLQLNKKYPYVIPKIDTKNIQGLSPAEVKELHVKLHARASELAAIGSPMMVELVQVAEDYLLAHNRDPNMSAWEQMQEREKQLKAQQTEAGDALEQLMGSAEDKSGATFGGYDEHTGGDQQALGPQNYSDVKKEILRQHEAIEAARKLRSSSLGEQSMTKQTPGGAEVPDDEEDETDFDIDLDYSPAQAGSSSRYETDFIEMGVLGRGGGGEVVKARNRLDGRIYAIKKVILEREDGALAKIGALQNQKLRREVTTISRMTHPNIVRYYQAWVEGDGSSDEQAAGEEHSISTIIREPSTAGPVGMIPEETEGEEDESESSGGFWASSRGPSSGDLADSVVGDVPEDSDTRSNIQAEESDSDEMFGAPGGMGLHNPLMDGLGFQNTFYNNMFESGDTLAKGESISVEDEESEWTEDDSSVKVGSGVKGRKILYIQMVSPHDNKPRVDFIIFSSLLNALDISRSTVRLLYES